MEMVIDPKSVNGALGWITVGALAAIAALIVGSMFPQIIPARATQSRL